MSTEPDWFVIEGLIKAGELSIREIARAHGITDIMIRRKIKREGWVRDAVGTVRARINEHFSGLSQDSPRDGLRQRLDDATASGVADMELGLNNARRILAHIADQLNVGAVPPRSLKTLTDANAGAVETIRRIRQLDTPTKSAITDKAHRDAIYAASIDP